MTLFQEKLSPWGLQVKSDRGRRMPGRAVHLEAACEMTGSQAEKFCSATLRHNVGTNAYGITTRCQSVPSINHLRVDQTRDLRFGQA